MPKKSGRGSRKSSGRGSKKSGSAKRYLAENWASILLLVIIIVLLIIGIVYSQKNCRRNRIENFDASSRKPCFVMFYADWCGHCKRTKPEFSKLEKTGAKNSKGQKVDIIAINADEEKDLAKKHNVMGYPTIKYFPNGLDGGSPVDFNGGRTNQEFANFISKQ